LSLSFISFFLLDFETSFNWSFFKFANLKKLLVFLPKYNEVEYNIIHVILNVFLSNYCKFYFLFEQGIAFIIASSHTSLEMNYAKTKKKRKIKIKINLCTSFNDKSINVITSLYNIADIGSLSLYFKIFHNLFLKSFFTYLQQ